MNNALVPAVIVVRHFDDVDPPSQFDRYCYPMPSPPSIEVPWRRLSPKGIGASLNYGNTLAAILQGYGLCPVSRVIAQDPTNPDKTQNPFDSIYPFLFSQNVKDVKLLKDGTALLNTPHKTLLPDQSHSTLICWDKQTLWGEATFDPTLFLGKMRRGNLPSLTNTPMKAPNAGDGIYVFTNYGSDDKFDLTIHGTLPGQSSQGPQPTHAPCPKTP
jgi:hypothetical protein